MLKTLSVSALFALTLSGSGLTAVEPGQGAGDPREDDEYTCLSDSTVHDVIEEYLDWEEGGEIGTPPTNPFPLYCLAKCVGPHASTGYRPIAGPTSPAEIVESYPFVDPYKWCDFVAEKACAQLGPDVEVGGSCFGSRT